jgi:hypothetical protein
VPGAVDNYFRPQVALYRRGAEAVFGASVRRLEYVYLNGVKSDDEIPIGRDALTVEQTTEAQLMQVDEVIERDFIAAYGSGVPGPVATAKDEKTCMFCAYKAICPGPVPE